VLDFAIGAAAGLLLNQDTLAAAWRAGRRRQSAAHGLGWFVQNYNGESVVWQLGGRERVVRARDGAGRNLR
jgi:hypothetical protein